jgi:N-acetylated-alpha-linked acidic dipeptidase
MKLDEAIHDSVSSDNLRNHLEWFSQVRRDTGGPGEDAAADYLVRTLAQSGIQANVHEFQAFLSYPREASLEVTTPQSHTIECVTHSFAQSTPEEGVSGEITLGKANSLAGLEGQIVLIDGLCTPATVLEGSKAQVKALVFVNQDRVIHNMIATTIWGTPTMDEIHRLPQIPVISINKQSGDKLKDLLAQDSVAVNIKTKVETGWYTSKLPEVIIQGKEEPDKFVLVGAHYCSWEYGVTDNATGDAVLLEMARILHEQRDQLKRSVRICWWPGHSHGRYSGSTWYADTFFYDLSKNGIVYHNIDSPGVRGATKYVARHTTAEFEDFCKDTIRTMTGQAQPPTHRPSRAADQAFLANGLPSFSCYPFLPEDHPDYRAWTGGCANAIWWHSSEDTLDKADLDILALDTRISTTAVANLCTMPILPVDPSASAAEMLEFARELQIHAGNEVDSSRFLTAAERFLGATSRLMELKNNISENQRSAYNDLLMALCRTTVSLTYSKGGRFSHDPAEWSPIMRNTRTSVFPGLNSALALEDLRDREYFGFVKAGIKRQLNRAVEDLEVATTTCETAIRDFHRTAIAR